jgi:hypothetical protein
MAVSLQAAIDWFIQLRTESNLGGSVTVTMSMHDDSGLVLFGKAQPEFVPDLPLQRTPTGTIATINRIGSWFTRQPSPGFSTRGIPRHDTNFYLASNRVDVGARVQPFRADQPVAMDFSVRRAPGILQLLRGAQVYKWRSSTAARP